MSKSSVGSSRSRALPLGGRNGRLPELGIVSVESKECRRECPLRHFDRPKQTVSFRPTPDVWARLSKVRLGPQAAKPAGYQSVGFRPLVALDEITVTALADRRRRSGDTSRAGVSPRWSRAEMPIFAGRFCAQMKGLLSER